MDKVGMDARFRGHDGLGQNKPVETKINLWWQMNRSTPPPQPRSQIEADSSHKFSFKKREKQVRI